jgi:hypothetical protein
MSGSIPELLREVGDRVRSRSRPGSLGMKGKELQTGMQELPESSLARYTTMEAGGSDDAINKNEHKSHHTALRGTLGKLKSGVGADVEPSKEFKKG